MKIGCNTFGLGKELAMDYEKTMERLKEAGVTAIEPCVQFTPNNPVGLVVVGLMKKFGRMGGVLWQKNAGDAIRDYRRRGFDVRSIHLFNTRFDMDTMTKVVAFMMENQIRYGVYSFQESSVDKIKKKAARINEISQMFRRQGLTLLIHNHYSEFQDDRGINVMTYLLENVPEMHAELDVGWCCYSHADPVAVLRQYPDRIPLIHIKEIIKGAKANGKSALCTAPGEGILPLRAILETAYQMPLDRDEAIIIDQDDSVNGDIIEEIRKGIQTMAQIWSRLEQSDI